MKSLELPVYPLWLTFLILFSAMLLRYFVLAGMAYRLAQKYQDRRISQDEADPKKIKEDIVWSIVSTLIFALSGTWLIRLWQNNKLQIYFQADEFGWTYFFCSLFIFMVLHDFYFYWTHRLLHLPRLFKSVHRVHHESRIPTAWTAFSFHPVEALIQALALPLLLLLLPIHWTVFILFLAVMTILGIINHLGYEFYPERFRTQRPYSYLISATHHQSHHQKVQTNFGLYFNVWDLIMGTEGKKGKYV